MKALDNLTYDVMFIAAFSGGKLAVWCVVVIGGGGGGGGRWCVHFFILRINEHVYIFVCVQCAVLYACSTDVCCTCCNIVH